MRSTIVGIILWASSLGFILGGCRKQPVHAVPSTPKAAVIRLDGPTPEFKPLIIIDNVKQPRHKKVNLDPADVVSVEAFTPSRHNVIQLYGRRARDGVIVIKTKKLNR